MFLNRINSANANVSKNLLKTSKLVLWFGATAYIVYKLIGFTGEYYHSFVISFKSGKQVFLLIMMVCLLSIVNWSLETCKWQILAGKLQKISFLRSFKGVLIGVAMGMVTIKRLGEFAGKAIVLDKGNRLEGAIINSAGTLCQLLVTLLAGTVSIFIIYYIQNLRFDSLIALNTIVAFSIAILVLALFVFITKKQLMRLLSRHKRFAAGYEKILVLKKVRRTEFIKLLYLSFFRYLVFMLQCYLLFSLAGLNLSLTEAFIFQSIVFLFMTIMPVTAFSELAVKGGIAILVFSYMFAGSIASYHGYEISLVLANGLLWLINLAIPALVGVIWGMDYGFSLKKQFV